MNFVCVLSGSMGVLYTPYLLYCVDRNVINNICSDLHNRVQQNMSILFIFSCQLGRKVTMGERDVKTSLLIIPIGHLIQQSLIMLLKKRFVCLYVCF
jgi:hypothetical protein